MVREEEIKLLVDYIDHDRQELLCIPLARPPGQHNPVYGFKAGAGPFVELICDVGMMNVPDCEGLVAIAPLEKARINANQFWCAKVRLSDGQEGWINVAKRCRDRENQPWRTWRMYFKLVWISKCLCDRCPRSWLEHGWWCKGK